MLRIWLFGVLRLELDGTNVSPPSSRRARLLLARLAVERREHSRGVLAAWLWPEVPGDSAGASLRNELPKVRAALGPDAGRYLQTPLERVGLTGPGEVWTDVGELERLLADGQVRGAFELWKPELLTGLEDDWVYECRDDLRQKMFRALGAAAGEAEAADDLDSALWFTGHQAALDPLDEKSHRDLMRRLAASGDRAGALKVYDKLAQRLREQLRTAPSPATRDLAATIRGAAGAVVESPQDATLDENPGDVACPYKGLQAFEDEDAALFFGREEQVEGVLAQLAKDRFVAVVGASGSGKSSFVRAGLLPRIGAATVNGATSACVVLTPGEHPVDELATAVSGKTAVRVSPDDLRADPGVLERATRQGGAGLVIVVDQFEELFTLCHEKAERRCFVHALIAAWRDPSSPVVVIVALRADFYGRVTDYTQLAAAVEAHQALIGPMSPADLRRAIELPAAESGLLLQPGLAQTMLEDLADEPGALPLLSHALLETWKRHRGLMLTVGGYREAGGVRGAIAQTAERTLQSLAKADQEIARSIFLSLTDVGEGAEPTRRRVERTELVAHAQSAESLDYVLGILADARLVTIEERTVAVAHEALIRHWPRLLRWLEEDRDDLLTHRRLTDAARQWDRLERESGALYRGARLAAAREWAADHADQLSRLERDFLTESQAAERSELEAAKRRLEVAKRRTRQLRILALGVGAFFVVAAVSTILALRQADKTREEERIGTSRALSSEAEARGASDPSLSVLLSLAAFNSADTPAARESLQSQTIRQRHVQRILTGHSGPVGAVAYSPDGRMLAAVGDAGITVWDRRGRTPPARLRQPTGGVRAVSFSRDGRLLAAGGDEGVAVWDTTRPARPRVRRAWRDRAATLAMSPDGRRIVFAGVGATLIVQDVVGGHRETIRVRDDEHIDGIAITPDSRRAVTAGDGGASVSNLATGARERRFRFAFRSQPTKTALALSADGRILATTAGSETHLWDRTSGTKLDTLTLVTGDLLAFRPDGDALAATKAGEDGDTKIVAYGVGAKGFLKDGGAGPAALPESLAVGERRNVSSLAYSPDGRTLASGSQDGTVTLWEPAGPDTIGDDKLRSIDTVAFGSEGGVLALGGAPRKGNKEVKDALSLVDVARRRNLYHTPCASFAAPRPRTSTWAVGGPSCGGVLALIDPSRRKGQRLVTELPPLPGRSPRRLLSEGFRFSPDGRLLAEQVRPIQPGRPGDGKVNQTGKELLIWDPKTPRAPIGRLKVAPPETLFSNTAAESFAFSPDGRTLAIGRSYDRSATDVGDDVKVLLWDTRRRMTTATIKLDSFVHSVAFDPSGGVLAVGLRDRVELWRVSDRTRVALIRGIHGSAQQLAFTPDGEKLAVADADGVQLWSVKPVATSGVRLPGGQGPGASGVFEIAFALSPDGRTLAVADGSQAAAVWNLAAESWHRQLCRILDRDFTRSERAQFLPPDQRPEPTCPEG